jgi:hypothetical protein
LDPALLKAARAEYSLNAINEVMHSVSEKNAEVQVHVRDLHQLVIDADGIYDDELAILKAQRKKKVEYCINNYVDIILSHSEIETNQEPEEDRKPASILDKLRELKLKVEPTSATSYTQKRKTDEKSTPASLSPKKKKISTNHSVKDQDNRPTTPTLRSQSANKGGEIAIPMTTALQKRKIDDGGETNTSKNSSLYVDAPKMRNIRDGVKRAKEKQAESVNKQHAKKADKGNKKQVLDVNDVCALTLDQRIKSIFKYLPVMVAKVTEGILTTPFALPMGT